MTSMSHPEPPATIDAADTESKPAVVSARARPAHRKPVPVMGGPDPSTATSLLGPPNAGVVSPLMGGPDPW
jgi:hypothetical protein